MQRCRAAVPCYTVEHATHPAIIHISPFTPMFPAVSVPGDDAHSCDDHAGGGRGAAAACIPDSPGLSLSYLLAHAPHSFQCNKRAAGDCWASPTSKHYRGLSQAVTALVGVLTKYPRHGGGARWPARVRDTARPPAAAACRQMPLPHAFRPPVLSCCRRIEELPDPLLVDVLVLAGARCRCAGAAAS